VSSRFLPHECAIEENALAGHVVTEEITLLTDPEAGWCNFGLH
jgi:hypothetical protein